MKIRTIEFFNHNIFGDLKLDFTDSDGKTLNTIIIAGENGVGKSQLLNSIFELANVHMSYEIKNERKTWEIELSNNELERLRNVQGVTIFNQEILDNIVLLTFNTNIVHNWEQITFQFKTTSGFLAIPGAGGVFGYSDLSQIFQIIFSDAEINFTPNAIQTVTATDIDSKDYRSEKSKANLATEITQLLIDVQSLDALEFTQWARTNPGKVVDEDKLDVRTKRFTSAFHYIFPMKKYRRIENVANQKSIVFEENGREMDISKLSSGEKQIVFRGSFLLKNKESSKGALILIDEPELSLHPNWQLKVLNFFKKLFTSDNGEQTSQLIISTHSPFILHNANRSDDKVIILKKDKAGKVIIAKEPKFFAWSTEKIVQEAFNIDHIIKEDKTTIFLEGETDEKYYNKCLEIFEKKNYPIEFKWIGRINDKGNVENTGDTALNQAKTFFNANMEQIKSKIVLFYDNDTNKPHEDIENLYIRKMKRNVSNTTFKIGVENLLTLIPEVAVSNFYSQKSKIDNYGAESIIRELEKSKLCNFICDDLDIENQKIVLEKLHEEIADLLLLHQNKN